MQQLRIEQSLVELAVSDLEKTHPPKESHNSHNIQKIQSVSSFPNPKALVLRP